MEEERGEKLVAMKAILDAQSTEKRADLSPDDAAKFDALHAEAEALTRNIERAQKIGNLETAATASTKAPEQRIGREDVNVPEQVQAAEQRTAFNEFCRSGELRASNTITTTTGSGAYVPKEVVGIESVAKLANSLKAAQAFYGVPAIPINGKVVISVPVLNLTDGDALAGDTDGESMSTNTDASITLTAATYNSKCQWLDNGVITAQSYDAASSLVPVLRVACERGQEAAFYTASIMTAGMKAAALETSSASVVSAGDLSALLFGLGAYAIGRCAYLVSMSMLAAMHSMADTTGRPVNKLTKDANGVFYWDGVPVFPTTNLEAIADGKYVAAAINVDACRVAASTAWVNRYTQNSARPNQTGFDYLQYAAFGVKSGAVKLLKVKAA